MNENEAEPPPSYKSLFPEEPPPSYDNTFSVVQPSAPSLPPESRDNEYNWTTRGSSFQTEQQRVQLQDTSASRESNFPRRSRKRNIVILITLGVCAVIGIIALSVIFSRNKCKGDMVYMKDMCDCQKDCTNLHTLWFHCTAECQSGCFCPKDRPIFYEGECIHESQCGDYSHPVTCPGEREFEKCASNCVLTSTCQTPYPTNCDEKCYSGCVCPFQTPIWNGVKCVREEDCVHQRCSSNSQILIDAGCGYHCTPTCRQRSLKDCPYYCEPRCRCPSHLPFFHDNECYSARTCPVGEDRPDGSSGVCSGGRRSVFCASPCPKTCFDMSPTCKETTCNKCECPFEKPYYQSGSCHTYTECRYFNPELPYIAGETDPSKNPCPIKRDDECSQGWILGVNKADRTSIFSCHEKTKLEREVHVISVEKPLGNSQGINEIKVEIGFDGSHETRANKVPIVLVLSNHDMVLWNLTYSRDDITIDQVYLLSPDTSTVVQHHVGFSVVQNTSRINPEYKWYGYGDNASAVEPLLKYARLKGRGISSFTGTKSTNKMYLKVGSPMCGSPCSARNESFHSSLYACPTAKNLSRYSNFKTHTFTTLDSVGSTGPREIDHPELVGTLVSLLDGMQCFTIPVTGRYNITASGASGGKLRNSGSGYPTYPRTFGATLSAVFYLEKGSKLRVLVGQTGGDLPNKQFYATGGGGGSFVQDANNNKPLLVAGGGGGIYSFSRFPPPACHGNLGPSGGVGFISEGIPGCPRYGATAAMPRRSGGGGGGYYGNGGYGIKYDDQPAKVEGGTAFVYGGRGSIEYTSSGAYRSDGGFGGGGAADAGAGGGGGYGGGTAGYDSNGNCGGGGGSYIDYASALAVSKTHAYNEGHGKVIITRLSD